MDFIDELLREAEEEARIRAAAPRRHIVLMCRTTCDCCGETTTEFLGLYEEREHPRIQETTLTRLDRLPLTPLPRGVKWIYHTVHYCASCAGIEDATTEEPDPES